MIVINIQNTIAYVSGNDLFTVYKNRWGTFCTAVYMTDASAYETQLAAGYRVLSDINGQELLPGFVLPELSGS